MYAEGVAKFVCGNEGSSTTTTTTTTTTATKHQNLCIHLQVHHQNYPVRSSHLRSCLLVSHPQAPPRRRSSRNLSGETAMLIQAAAPQAATHPRGVQAESRESRSMGSPRPVSTYVCRLVVLIWFDVINFIRSSVAAFLLSVARKHGMNIIKVGMFS